jgi:hypothetical protein
MVCRKTCRLKNSKESESSSEVLQKNVYSSDHLYEASISNIVSDTDLGVLTNTQDEMMKKSDIQYKSF